MAMTKRGAAAPQDAQITPSGTAQKVTAIVRQDVPNGGSLRGRVEAQVTLRDG